MRVANALRVYNTPIKKRNKIGMILQEVSIGTGFLFNKAKNTVFGNPGSSKFMRIQPSVVEEKIIQIKRIRKKKEEKVLSLFKLPKLPKITIPELPEIDWKRFIPFAKGFARYVLILGSCFLIVLGTIYFFSNQILEALIKEHNIFQQKRVIELIKLETLPYVGQLERLSERMNTLEAGAIIQYHVIKPKRYNIMGTNKYIER